MQLGMIGLGRMGANMVRRLVRGGHDCVVFDTNAANVAALVAEGATGSQSLDDFVHKLAAPRAIWRVDGRVRRGIQHSEARHVGKRRRSVDAETAPLRNAEHYEYDFNVADVAELWRRGSVVASWLLDLTASALASQPDLHEFSGRVSDSGEGRWTVLAAIEESAPTPVLTAALYQRFASRGESEFADRLLSAMGYQFGGHVEQPAGV